jgi:ribosomal protein L13
MSVQVQYSILKTDITWKQTAAVQKRMKLILTKIFSFKHTENSVTVFVLGMLPYFKKQHNIHRKNNVLGKTKWKK